MYSSISGKEMSVYVASVQKNSFFFTGMVPMAMQIRRINGLSEVFLVEMEASRRLVAHLMR